MREQNRSPESRRLNPPNGLFAPSPRDSPMEKGGTTYLMKRSRTLDTHKCIHTRAIGSLISLADGVSLHADTIITSKTHHTLNMEDGTALSFMDMETLHTLNVREGIYESLF